LKTGFEFTHLPDYSFTKSATDYPEARMQGLRGFREKDHEGQGFSKENLRQVQDRAP
jgi:hypothetical protein